MSRQIPLTVLAWEGPQARAYLVRMKRAGITPERIILMIKDPRNSPLAKVTGRGLAKAEKAQERAHNFHPHRTRASNPQLMAAITNGLAGQLEDPAGLISEMFDSFSYDDFGAPVERVAVSGYRDPALREAIAASGAELLLFSGGGIMPAEILELPGLRVIHVHTGFLPDVRGADVLLWSLMVRGRAGVSAFLMTPRLDDGDLLGATELPPLAIPLAAADRPDDDTLYRSLFSFIDPLIRAEFVISQVLEPASDFAALPATAQDLNVGVTFHFMAPQLRSAALAQLFPTA